MMCLAYQSVGAAKLENHAYIFRVTCRRFAIELAKRVVRRIYRSRNSGETVRLIARSELQIRPSLIIRWYRSVVSTRN